MNESKSDLSAFEALGVKIYENETDFSKICRTCLRETSDNDLSNETICVILSGKLVRIYEMFEEATGLKIESSDKLPHHVCSACLTMVNNLYAFRTQSQRAEEILKSILGKIKAEPDDKIEETVPEKDKEPEIIEGSEGSGGEENVKTEHILEYEKTEHIDKLSEPKEEYQAPESCRKYEGSEPGENRISELRKKYAWLRTDIVKLKIPCPYCSKMFKRQLDIIRHYKDEHPKRKPFKCKECLASYAHVSSLFRHKKLHLPGAKLKTCAVCNETSCIDKTHLGKRRKYKK